MIADELAGAEPFRSAFGGWRRSQPVLPPDVYARLLYRCGFADPKVQLIVYPHILASREDVVEWVKGTLLTEYKRHLPAEVYDHFVEEYRGRLLTQLERGAAVFLPVQADTLLGAAVSLRTRHEMLKGTRDGILKKVQPTSIHGQISWDVYFTDVEDPDGQINVARIGPEAVIGHNLEPGDRIQVDYVVGVAIRVTRLVPTS